MLISTNKTNLNLFALVPYPLDTTPSQRFRIEQWIPYLQTQGISVDLYPFADDELMRLLHKPGHRSAKALANVTRFLRRCGEVVRARGYDAVLIHRAACIAGPALLERFVALSGRPVIYDFDDAIFKLHTTDANRRFGWLKFPGKTATICRISDRIVVGNSWLADYAKQFNHQVTVIPTSIDTDHYRPIERTEPNRRLIVGWTGSSTSQTHLEMFAPLLRELTQRREIELRVISNREPVLPGINYVWLPWSAEDEVTELTHFDIGIMPMPDDEWAKGKCALKALQYMAMGIPTVCSAVGANCDVIQHGENGLLALTSEQWINALQSLIDDADLRSRLGAMGRRTVEEKYSMLQCANQFGQVVRDAVTSQQKERVDGRIIEAQTTLK